MMHITVKTILLGAAVTSAMPTAVNNNQPRDDTEPELAEWDGPNIGGLPWPDAVPPEMFPCFELLEEFFELGNAYYNGTYKANEPPPKDRWAGLTSPDLPRLDPEHCLDVQAEFQEYLMGFPDEMDRCHQDGYKACRAQSWPERKACDSVLDGNDDCRPQMKKWIKWMADKYVPYDLDLDEYNPKPTDLDGSGPEPHDDGPLDSSEQQHQARAADPVLVVPDTADVGDWFDGDGPLALAKSNQERDPPDWTELKQCISDCELTFPSVSEYGPCVVRCGEEYGPEWVE